MMEIIQLKVLYHVQVQTGKFMMSGLDQKSDMPNGDYFLINLQMQVIRGYHSQFMFVTSLADGII